MKSFNPYSGKTRFLMMLMFVLTALCLIAAAPMQEVAEEPPIPEAALTFLVMLALPAVAQAYKMYLEKGGKQLSGDVINWVIFAGGVLASFAWGGAGDFLRTLALPALDASDPLALTSALLTFINAVIVAGGQVVGVATIYYLVLKRLVFTRVPALQTDKMLEEQAAAE